MKKKLSFILGAVCAVSLGAAVFTACASDTVPVHNHRYIDHEAVAATCVAEGNVAYQECLYCGEFFVDGNKVGEQDLVTAIDLTNHTLSDVAARAAKCIEPGVLAHKECDECHKLFVDGTEVQKPDVEIAPRGSHLFEGSKLTCSDCDGYKLLYNGEYYVIDKLNYQPVVQSPIGSFYKSAAAEKEPYLTDYPKHRLTFATQGGNNMSAGLNGENWVLSSSKDSALSCFTRFAYGEGSTPYVGRLIMTFDLTVTNAEAEIQRVGAKVVDAAAVVPNVNTYQQAKLLGTNASEENNADRKFEANTTYRFAYEIELTEETQLIQIFMCFGAGTQTATISNMHFINLEGKTGRLGSTLLSFGKATDALTAVGSCAHAWKYEVKGVEATCLSEGLVQHDYCPQCGERTKDGNPVTNTTLPKAEHNYGELHAQTQSTCEVKGHDAYYQCSVCHEYFNESKQQIDGVTEYDVVDHNGEWKHDAEKHWMHCTMCDKDVKEGAHVPGPEATETSAQTCTVCSRVLVPALSHVHTPGELVPAKAATCTENGNPAYYQCSGADCGKYFSDAECTTEIPEGDILIASTGHTMEEKVEAKPVTCTEDGNLEYYHCTACDKYFADSEGLTDITETYFLAKLGHAMTYHAVVAEATCAERAHAAYYSCANCHGVFSDEAGTTALEAETLFSGEKLAHNYDAEGVCASCGAKKVAHTITAKENAFGPNASGATIKELIVANPGTWGVQYNDNNTSVTIDEGVLKIEVPSNKTNQRAAFIRIIPANADGTAFVGAYRVSFDFKFTKGSGELQLGFSLQNASSTVAGDAQAAETKKTFEIGKTYRFTAYVESLNANEFFQFTVRNMANGGAKGFEISNVSIEYESSAAKTGMYDVERIEFGVPVEAAVTPEVEALLPENKDRNV